MRPNPHPISKADFHSLSQPSGAHFCHFPYLVLNIPNYPLPSPSHHVPFLHLPHLSILFHFVKEIQASSFGTYFKASLVLWKVPSTLYIISTNKCVQTMIVRLGSELYHIYIILSILSLHFKCNPLYRFPLWKPPRCLRYKLEHLLCICPGVV